jgi:hypothetical protein
MILRKSKPTSLFLGEAVLLFRAKLLFVAATERPLVFEVDGASRGHERDMRNSSPSSPRLGLFL